MEKDKILLIVESPAKAKTIQKYLGSQYLVRASVGHIKALPADTFGVEIDTFRPKYKFMTDKKDRLTVILDASKFAKEVFIASDPDREGEAIAFHLQELLESSGLPVKRVKFKEITKKEILKVIENPELLDSRLYDAQQARRVLDRLVGFLASPFVNKSLAAENVKLSAGRVQSVTLRLLAEREKEIQSFKQEEYWNLDAFFSTSPDTKKSEFSAKLIEKNKITTQKKAEEIENDLLSSTFQVSKIKEEKKKRPPEPPFITSSLCSCASSALRFPTEKTMKLAQALYESGLITYLRTDSARVSDDAIAEVRKWLTDNRYKIPKNTNIYKNKNDSAQEAHEAIRPTDVTRTAITGSTDEIALYNLIWKRFVASQMLPAEFASTQIEIASSSKHIFRLSGSILKEENWLAIYKGQNKTSDVLLPNLTVNQILHLAPPKVKKEQKFTQPPSRYTEGSLISELEKREIGRPGTYSAIFTKLHTRGYVSKKSDSYIVLPLGIKVIEVLEKYFRFLDFAYTADMEKKLDLIAEGKLEYLTMMREFYSGFCEELKAAYVEFAKTGDELCVKCSIPTVLRHGKYGYFLACLNYPLCQETISVSIVDGNIVTKEKQVLAPDPCPKCQSEMYKRDGEFGPFYSCSRWPKCYGQKKIIYPYNCPECKNNGMTIFKTQGSNLKLSCIKYPECKGVEELPENLQSQFIPPQEINLTEFSLVRKLWNKGI